MKTKVWKVTLKENGEHFLVEAPSKRIAKWCAANVYMNDYCVVKSAKDFTAKRYHYMP